MKVFNLFKYALKFIELAYANSEIDFKIVFNVMDVNVKYIIYVKFTNIKV